MMGGGNDGGSSDEEEEEDGEHGVDSADERSKVRRWLSDRSIARTAPGGGCARDPSLFLDIAYTKGARNEYLYERFSEAAAKHNTLDRTINKTFSYFYICGSVDTVSL